MIDVDMFVIERVFQPISDRAAHHVTCYGIAAFVITGAIVAAIASAVMVDDVWLRWNDILWLVGAVFLLLRAHHYDAHPPPANAALLERGNRSAIFFRWGTLPIVLDLGVTAAIGHDLPLGLMSVAFLLSVPYGFFMACVHQPPAARERREVPVSKWTVRT